MALGIASASAQITEGEPSAKKIRTGNRPEAGNFGLYMGVTSNMFSDMFNSRVHLTALPLINFKYMATDQLELRLGFEFYENSERLKGDYTDSNIKLSSFERQGKSNGMFYPGVAYHFSKSNILDVYVGGEIPIGWNSTFVRHEESSLNYRDAVDTFSTKTTKNAFQIGIGAFIGLQVFVANLPLALGVEYGISARFDAGLKYKNEINHNGKKQIFYTADSDAFSSISSSRNFDTLKAKKGQIGNQVRLTISYYFK